MPNPFTYETAQASRTLLDSLLCPLLASIIAASVTLFIAWRYSGRQLKLLQRAELTRVACSLVQIIFSFRNYKEIEKLRGALRNDLKRNVNAALATGSKKAAEVVGEWLKNNDQGVSEEQVRHFLSNMNTLAWQILLLPPTTGPISRDRFGQRPLDRDALIEIIHENLILEWDVLAPWIAEIRRGDWWLIHLRELVEYAKDRHSALTADVRCRQTAFSENEKRRQLERTVGGAP